MPTAGRKRAHRSTKGKKMNNETGKAQSKPEGLQNANLQILRRVDWERGMHPRLHELLQLLHSAPDEPRDPAPMIEITFDGERLYLMPEGVAEFACRLYGTFRDRREPFTQETLDECLKYIGVDMDKIATVAELLYDDGLPDEPATGAEEADEIE